MSCIILNRLTDLHVLGNGSVISMSYRDHFLVPYVRFFRYAVNTYLILVDYNVRTDRAHLDDEFLKSEDVCLTDCPARYPDINSCLGHCGRTIATRFPPLRSVQSLKIAYLEEWD